MLQVHSYEDNSTLFLLDMLLLYCLFVFVVGSVAAVAVFVLFAFRVATIITFSANIICVIYFFNANLH